MINKKRVVLRPQPGPQEMFLATSADIAFFGGAAGGGKSYALLLEPLRHVLTVPGFTAVIFRRVGEQITKPGGLWDSSRDMYSNIKGAVDQEYRKRWTFKPHDNRIQFASIQYESNISEWQGSQIAYMGWDEVTHFTRRQFFYIALSRGRSMSGVRPYVRATYNPVPPDDPIGGWIHEFVSWYLDDNQEYAIRERSGVIRYFIQRRDRETNKDNLIWADTAEELIEEYNLDVPPKSFTFVSAKVTDNKILLQIDPTYLANLRNMSYVDQQRLEMGNHKVREEAGNIFNKNWFPIIPESQVPFLIKIVRYWDIAATEKQLEGRDPDYTVGTLVGICERGRLYVLDMKRGQWGVEARDSVMRTTCITDYFRWKGVSQLNELNRYTMRWEKQPGAAGVSLDYYIENMITTVIMDNIMPNWKPEKEQAPFLFEPCSIKGDKVLRANPAAAKSKQGRIFIVNAPWNEDFLNETHNFPDGGKDDIVDTLSGADNVLSFIDEIETDETVVMTERISISPY